LEGKAAIRARMQSERKTDGSSMESRTKYAKTIYPTHAIFDKPDSYLGKRPGLCYLLLGLFVFALRIWVWFSLKGQVAH